MPLASDQVYLSGIIFFVSAAFVLSLCEICSELLLRSPFYRFHHNTAETISIQDVNVSAYLAALPCVT